MVTRLVLRWLVLTGVPLALLIALLLTTGTTLTKIGVELATTPFWMWLTILVALSCAQAVGAYKWQRLRNWVSPGAVELQFSQVLELTTVGSLVAHVLPPQMAHVIVRWLFVKDHLGQGRGVLASTLFEHFFELVVYGFCAVSAMCFYLTGIAPLGLMIFLIGILAVSVFFAHKLIALTTKLARRLQQRRPKNTFFAAFSNKMQLIAAMPKTLSAEVYALTILLVLGRGGIVAIIVAAMAPAIDLWRVVAGFPGVAFLSSLPISPAGLGIAEWGWSALLIAAGAGTTLAAAIAVSIRLVGVLCLLVIAACLRALNLVRRGIS